MCSGMQGDGGLHIFRVLDYSGWEMVHRHTQHLSCWGWWGMSCGGGWKAELPLLEEVMGRMAPTDLPRGRVKALSKAPEEEGIWGALKRGLLFRIQGVNSAAEQTIYQDLGDRCFKEKKIFV